MEELIRDLGENYEYLRTILVNRVKLVKLESAENISKILSYILLGSLIGLLGSFSLLGGLIVLVILLSQWLGSLLIAIALCIVLIVILITVLYVFRKVIIYKPIEKFFYSRFLKTDDDDN